MLAWLKTLFWGILAPLAILIKGGLFSYMIAVLVLTLVYVEWLKRNDDTMRLLVIQAVLVVLFILISSAILLLGGSLALLSQKKNPNFFANLSLYLCVASMINIAPRLAQDQKSWFNKNANIAMSIIDMQKNKSAYFKTNTIKCLLFYF